MTRKEQNKILDDKIKANNAQLLALRNINKSADDDDDDYDDDDHDDVNNAYKKIIEDYKNDRIEYKEIKEQLNNTYNAIKIYKK